jgi:adenylyltransferase/sulfurtransferase
MMTYTLGEDIYPRLSWFRQEKVAAARMMVVGCGALGNEVLKNLALFGVGHIVVVDFDCIEPSNLSRSVLFNSEDAAQRRQKAAVAAERIRQLNPAIEVMDICGDIAYDVGLGLIRQMDVVVGCVDNRWARYCINRLAMRAGKPWVDGGIDGLEGTARVFMPGQNCYACNLGTEGRKELRLRLSCANIIRHNEIAERVPTTPVIASVIGAVEAQEAMKLIHREEMEQGELTSLCGKMFCYEGQHLTTRTVSFQAYDDDCPLHEQWAPVEQVALAADQTVEEALALLACALHVSDVSFSLTADCFVDWLSRRDNELHYSVMLPGHLVASWVGENRQLAGLPWSTFYQHEYREIDKDFPYQEMTLRQLGIPDEDVLWVHTDQGDRYVQLEVRKLRNGVRN